MTTLAIVCFDTVTDIDVMLHWDILNRPRTMFGQDDDAWQVRLLGTKPRHTTLAGLTIDMHGFIDEARDADVVLHASGAQTRTLMSDAVYLDDLALSPNDQFVASQCSGALVLAAAGCLDGLAATTYPTARSELESFGVKYVEEPLVVHDRVATAAGCLAGVDLDKWLLEKLLAPELAERCVASAMPWGSGLS